jgi:hypothetical protein
MHEESSKPLLATCFLLLSCSACCLLHASILFGLFFDPEDGGDMFLRSVSLLTTDYVALYARRQNSSQSPLRTSNPTFSEAYCQTPSFCDPLLRETKFYARKKDAEVSLVYEYFSLFVFARLRYIKDSDLNSSKHSPNLNCY